MLTAANDTVAGGFTDAATGYFIIKGISAGTYQVEFSATDPYIIKETKTVTVTNKAITDMGAVNLNN